jgi:hypothetical protein
MVVLAFPVRAAEALVLDRSVLETTQLLDVLHHFENCIDDAVDVFLAPKKQVM